MRNQIEQEKLFKTFAISIPVGFIRALNWSDEYCIKAVCDTQNNRIILTPTNVKRTDYRKKAVLTKQHLFVLTERKKHTTYGDLAEILKITEGAVKAIEKFAMTKLTAYRRGMIQLELPEGLNPEDFLDNEQTI